jgi:DNA-binding phage protein
LSKEFPKALSIADEGRRKKNRAALAREHGISRVTLYQYLGKTA